MPTDTFQFDYLKNWCSILLLKWKSAKKMYFKKCLFPLSVLRTFNYRSGKSILLWSKRVKDEIEDIQQIKIDYKLGVKYDTHPNVVKLPCGSCMKCQNNKNDEWVLRNSLEALDYDEKCFVTLTYSDEYLKNVDGKKIYDKNYSSLYKRDYQLFMKRLRKANPGKKISYFLSGEYGKRDNTWRPHYHIIIYGWQPNDLVFYKKSKKKGNLYTSITLDNLWGMGQTRTGIDINPKTIKYVAKYLQKMQTFKPGALKPFIAMSTGDRKGEGIAGKWFLKNYTREYFQDGYIFYGSRKYPIPRYFEKLVEELKLDDIVSIKIIKFEREVPQMSEAEELSQLRNYILLTESRNYPISHLVPIYNRFRSYHTRIRFLNDENLLTLKKWYNKFKTLLFSAVGVPWNNFSYMYL